MTAYVTPARDTGPRQFKVGDRVARRIDRLAKHDVGVVERVARAAGNGRPVCYVRWQGSGYRAWTSESALTPADAGQGGGT
jgi:hypothetical protein